MIIKNKRTHKQRYVTQEEWVSIVNHPQLKNCFTVIDRTDIIDNIKGSKAKDIIIPEEIINFKKLKIKKSKKEKSNE
jgi:hypothetical protein